MSLPKTKPIFSFFAAIDDDITHSRITCWWLRYFIVVASPLHIKLRGDSWKGPVAYEASSFLWAHCFVLRCVLHLFIPLTCEFVSPQINVQDEVEDKPRELQMWSITTGLKGFFQVSVIFCSTLVFWKSDLPTWVYASEMRCEAKVKSGIGLTLKVCREPYVRFPIWHLE